MAGLWQQLCSLWQGQAPALLHLILHLWVLYPLPSVVSLDTTDNSPHLKGYEVVKGNFSRTFLRVGYHKIAEVPAGACNISIQETIKSRNYLALQMKNGMSIINGNWVIDRPGVFTALGTQLMYKRPNEIRSRSGESITAPGPLTEDLHLIYQQPGPSVYYEYTLPLKNIYPSPEPVTQTDKLPLAEKVTPSHPEETVKQEDVSKNDIIKEKLHPNQVPSDPNTASDPTPLYMWTKTGQTECSTTCGTGRRQTLWECVEKESLVTVPADLCDTALEPTNREEDCNLQSCPAYWDMGEWSDCSRKCGPGHQRRQVICRQVTHVHANGTETAVTVAQGLCGSTDMPVTESTCQLKICSQWEIRSEWSPCSVPCGVGQRSREVVCISNQGEVEPDEECNMNLKPDTFQNCDMGACARSWFTSFWSQQCTAECGTGNRTRTAICLMDHVTDLPLGSCEGERPSEVMSCDSGPCQQRLEWYTGPWGQCSAECGNGTQTRSIACILNNNGHMEVVEQFKCSSLPQPITAQPCRLKPCGVQWYVTEWSTCSRSCNGGYRVREVRCLTDNIAPSDKCDSGVTPENREECNKQACLAEINPSCSDQYHSCTVVVQARLCIYPYYRSVCCASCSRSQKTYPNTFQMNRVRR
ncbi:thrombospondin type-1 domain-containing protein 4 isoform X2 [Sphaeramia orbicularis]|uniref:thrombospondin type-1 domain-containing protein 4 isoform X2 n=1 Tax=Sphaeramia orbicularis TaxID=375764 RepID=UPI00117D9ED4|nr:thrombospondin type-1 domain-containing protein 4-like isoform X2 [Sphaeramia orbicularis]